MLIFLIIQHGRYLAYFDRRGHKNAPKRNPRIMGPHNPGKKKHHPGEFTCQPTERTVWNGHKLCYVLPYKLSTILSCENGNLSFFLDAKSVD